MPKALLIASSSVSSQRKSGRECSLKTRMSDFPGVAISVAISRGLQWMRQRGLHMTGSFTRTQLLVMDHMSELSPMDQVSK